MHMGLYQMNLAYKNTSDTMLTLDHILLAVEVGLVALAVMVLYQQMDLVELGLFI